MFRIAAESLIKVDVLHSYYQSGRSPDLKIVPSQDTQRLLKNFKQYFLPQAAGFEIGLQVRSVTPPDTFEPYIPLDQPYKFTFYFFSKNPHLFTFSDLPTQRQPNEIIYLSNRFDKSFNSNGTDLLLLSGHNAGDSFVSENDFVRLVAGFFKYTLSQPNALVTIADSLTGTVVWPTVESPQGEGGTIECDLSKLPNGRYRLEEDNGFFVELFKDNAAAAAGVLGVIEIFSDTPAPDHQFLETIASDVVAHPITYNVRFLARNSTWRYFVIAQSEGVLLNNFSITNPAPDNFTSEAVPASIEARYGVGNISMWESANGIQFQELPGTEVNYEYNPPGPGIATGQLSIPPLERAGPRTDDAGNIITDGGGDPVFFSEEYIIL